VACLRDPLGSGLKKYDLSTPKAALESHARMEADSDVRALRELEERTGSKRAKEKAKTLQVHKEVNHRGHKLLFISYKEDGLSKHDVVAFKKDDDADVWRPTPLGAFAFDKGDDDLADQVQRWKRLSDKAPMFPGERRLED